jgi:hypothetical protein
MDWFSDFVAARFKAFFAALVVGFTPAVIKAFETSFGVDIPGSWEANFQTWLLALFAGLTVNYVSNKPAPPKA